MNLLDLLCRLDSAGAVPTRHGRFLGFKGKPRLTPELQAAVAAHEAALLRLLKDEPTPYRARQGRCQPARAAR